MSLRVGRGQRSVACFSRQSLLLYTLDVRIHLRVSDGGRLACAARSSCGAGDHGALFGNQRI